VRKENPGGPPIARVSLVTMSGWSFFRTQARNLAPYPDLARRRRVRKAARGLVTVRAWPKPPETGTGTQLAQLALLRLLWLQREIRRSVRLRHLEASGMLARACVETCLSGLYWLYVANAASQFDAQTLQSVMKLCLPMTGPGGVPESLLKDMAAAIGPSKSLPNMSVRVQAVDSVTGRRTAQDLYRRAYEPLSMLFVHSDSLGLMRYVDGRGLVKDRPIHPWTNFAMLRTADGCVGVLAASVAEQAGLPNQEFVSYANSHLGRAWLPLVALPGWWKDYQYVRSGQAATDSPDARDVWIRDFMRRFVEATGGVFEPEVVDRVSEVLITAIAKDLPRDPQ
jgi:hypothetical protein